MPEELRATLPRCRTQREILQFVRDFLRERHYAPSMREIAGGVGLKSVSTVAYHLKQLRAQGLLESDPTRSRALRVPAEQAGRVPVLGVVAAGRPILAVENIDGYLTTDLAGDSRFALRVKGDSMTGAGILPGDYVIVRPQQEAISGQIVVALLEDVATVKRFHRGPDGVWLLPENDAYEPIDAREARILGRVIGLQRKY